VKAWTEWETARRQVAIAGRVLDERDRPVAGAEVTVTPMPPPPPRAATDQKWAPCLAEADGIYYFLDLPAGTYTVKGMDARTGAAGETTVAVGWSKDRKVDMVVADLRLSRVATR
jgi:hypothetical protein